MSGADASELTRFARTLRDTAADGLQDSWGQSLRTVASPVGKTVLRAGARKLPTRGGLAAKVAAGTAQVQILAPLRVELVLAASGYDLPGMDSGVVKHPVFGRRRRKWATQRIRAGAFATPFRASADQIERELTAATSRILGTIAERRGR